MSTRLLLSCVISSCALTIRTTSTARLLQTQTQAPMPTSNPPPSSNVVRSPPMMKRLEASLIEHEIFEGTWNITVSNIMAPGGFDLASAMSTSSGILTCQVISDPFSYTHKVKLYLFTMKENNYMRPKRVFLFFTSAFEYIVWNDTTVSYRQRHPPKKRIESYLHFLINNMSAVNLSKINYEFDLEISDLQNKIYIINPKVTPIIFKLRLIFQSGEYFEVTGKLDRIPSIWDIKNNLFLLLLFGLTIWRIRCRHNYGENFCRNTGTETRILMTFLSIVLTRWTYVKIHEDSVLEFKKVELTILCLILFLSFYLNVNITSVAAGYEGPGLYQRFLRLYGLAFVVYLAWIFSFDNLMYRYTHEFFSAIVVCFLNLQLMVTLFRAKNRKVFIVEHQITGWLPLVLVVTDFVMFDFLRFKSKPNRTLAILSMVTWAIVTVFMWLQSKKGIYFFIPSRWLDGWRAQMIDYIELDGMNCMHPGCIRNENGERAPMNILDRQNGMLRTPCNHTFHRECLEIALLKNYECPNQECRERVLPDDEGW